MDPTSDLQSELIVGFHEEVPGDVVAGGQFLGAEVLRVDHALTFALVRAADRASFEQQALEDPRVEYVELNRRISATGGGPGDGS